MLSLIVVLRNIRACEKGGTPNNRVMKETHVYELPAYER
jgi:hypothetical protein